MKIAQVFVEHPIMHLDHTFTYACDGFSLQRGVRVSVPFGKTSIVGFVMKVETISEQQAAEYGFTIRSIHKVIDEEPLLNEELLALGHWMAKTCIVPVISCFQCMLPAKLKPKSTHGHAKLEIWVRYCRDQEGLTVKQRSALEALKTEKEMLRSQFYQIYKTPAKKLVELGLAEIFEKEAQAQLKPQEITEKDMKLSLEQHQALEALKQIQSHEIILLHGATGSGKTEVFLQLARSVMNRGKQVLILVPEISLTPQMVKRVTARFGSHVAIYHSGLNAQEKYEQYQLVRRHQVQIVVGTRSAVFMPFDNLGVIIMDEEHDTSYKQDSAPRYHCRDIAIKRGAFHQAPVVLASATPSLETYARAVKGVYRLIAMPSRINGSFPHVKLVEMRKAVGRGESYLLSNELMAAMYERLQKKEQIMLLLNRRGYTPILRCIGCGHVVMCPHCEVAMSYHKDDKQLKCHTCGYTMPVPNYCPACGSDTWRYLGLGTQKLEELVQIKFPDAKIIRMDADTTGRKHAHEELLSAFGDKKADILLGTQMIAKGLDFENVTLVGIINGDAMLNRSDYRSAELTYDLLEQACGRSGRGSKDGEVIIQAYDTAHYAIQCAAQHDYRTFFQNEMKYRHIAGYPPYTYLASMIFSHTSQDEVAAAAARAKQVLEAQTGFRVLGPAQLNKRKDEVRMRILLKGKQQELLAGCVRMVYDAHLAAKAKARLDIDLSPVMLD